MTGLKKVPSVFYQSEQGARPVRDFILGLSRADRRIIGNDIATVEYGWPIGKPTCAPLGLGLWEVRSSLTSNRIARVIFTLHEDVCGYCTASSRRPRKPRNVRSMSLESASRK